MIAGCPSAGYFSFLPTRSIRFSTCRCSVLPSKQINCFPYLYEVNDAVVNIESIVNSIHELTPEAWTDLNDLFQEINLNKNDYLLREGERTQHCYFLKEGVVRVFYGKDGNEYNKTFFLPGMFPTAITALISGEPSRLFFQALTPCKLIRFSYPKFRDLFEEHRCLERLLLRIMEIQWIKKEKHDIEMVTNDATANYLIFREQYKGLENLIPQYHIASYLGITPIQLSRIRTQLTKSGA